MFDTTIILISYKSEKLILNFIKKLPKLIPIIIIDNSNSFLLEDVIKKEYSNLEVFVKNNDGVSSALNYAVEKIKTKYFLQISPDIDFDYKDIWVYLDFAKKLNNKFAAIGPRFLDIKKKSHKQISESVDYDSIDSIHGSCMFINKECFNKIGRFDENYFLYFEETDYCYRGKKLSYKSYQINKSKVRSQGRSVELGTDSEKITNILNWHFIWSKFYFNKKKYGKLISLLFFLPIIIRIIFKIFLNKIIKNEKQLKKYKIRYDGLINSIKGNKSSLRP
jgi:N-acetylglucosaminyl-diphospho-decaprenol L-rhamnosyltransferase